jgi:RNA-directed DNA polymerase
LEADYDCRWHARVLYCRPHLPQGAPTSPALANLCTYRADCRLSGLARSVGAQYTRYADDLAFSGDRGFERGIERFSTHVAAILIEEGFHVHHRKTRVMRQGVRQHLAGVVVNRHLNIMGNDFDRLKATLTNCIRLGPEGQNRDTHANFRSHLEGRINFVEMINPIKGNRLRRIFEQIEWN